MLPLKILLVHECFPPDYNGGGEYVVLETARHLQTLGHRVSVLSTGDPAVTEYQGIPTKRLRMSRYRFNLAWREVMEAGRDADIIHTFTYHATLPAFRAGRKLGKPVILGVLALFDDIWLQMRGPLVGRALRSLERRLMRLPRAGSIYLSEESHALARHLLLDKPDDVVIAPGISVQDYHAESDKPFVMFAGKLDIRKGIDTVLQVAERLPHVPFRMIGWGERYQRISETCPPNVTLEPFIDRLHLASRLAQARIFLFPTKAETFGLIVAEAMASGCAIVSTSTLPFEGIRIQPDSPDSAFEAVRDLWLDPARCAAMASANQIAAQRYSWKRHVEQLDAIYRRALGDPST